MITTRKRRARWALVLPMAVLVACLTAAGCAKKTAPSPTTGTAAGGILNDPQASAVLKAQAAQQQQIGLREQQMEQAQHAGSGAVNPASPK